MIEMVLVRSPLSTWTAVGQLTACVCGANLSHYLSLPFSNLLLRILQGSLCQNPVDFLSNLLQKPPDLLLAFSWFGTVLSVSHLFRSLLRESSELLYIVFTNGVVSQ